MQGLSLVAASGPTLYHGAWASHCCGFSHWGPWALGHMGFSSCGLKALERRPSGTWALVAPLHVGSSQTRDLTRVSALAGGFLTKGPPGTSQCSVFLFAASGSLFRPPAPAQSGGLIPHSMWDSAYHPGEGACTVMTLDSVWDPSWGRVDHSGRSLRTLAVVSVGNQPHQLPVLSMEHKASLGSGDAVDGEGRGPDPQSTFPSSAEPREQCLSDSVAPCSEPSPPEMVGITPNQTTFRSDEGRIDHLSWSLLSRGVGLPDTGAAALQPLNLIFWRPGEPCGAGEEKETSVFQCSSQAMFKRGN